MASCGKANPANAERSINGAASSQVEDQPRSEGSGNAHHHAAVLTLIKVAENRVAVVGFSVEDKGFARTADSFFTRRSHHESG